jgi:hypothetical protein
MQFVSIHGQSEPIDLTLPPPAHMNRTFRRTQMTYLSQSTHKLIALIAALAITALLQGTLLAGFEHLASEPSQAALASCK